MLVSCHQPDKTLITRDKDMHLTNKEVYWVLIVMYHREQAERHDFMVTRQITVVWFGVVLNQMR
jgi:hypothetical protein